MSIRFIGYQSYAPVTSGNYSRGKTKIIKFSTQPHQLQQKAQKINRYREQLDKQVEQMRRRKQGEKERQLIEDQRRERQFYESLEYAKNNQNQSPKNKRNFHFSDHEQMSGNGYRNYHNPEQSNKLDFSQDNFLFESRLAHIGRNKIKLDVPVFQSRCDLTLQQDDYSAQTRRRYMIDEMDKSLLGAHMAIQRSKGSIAVAVDEQLQRLRRRLRTEQTGISSENDAGDMYNLPYKNYLYNSPHRYRHKREGSWM